MSLPVLILSGTIGTGKTTVGVAMQALLEHLEIPHAFLDLDRLAGSYPKKGRFNEQVVFEALTALWPVYESAGADRLVLARVVEDSSELESYRAALGDCSITVVLLTAPDEERRKRIAERESGESLRWHLSRSTELDQILKSSNAYDFEIPNDRDPSETARKILEKVNWLTMSEDAV